MGIYSSSQFFGIFVGGTIGGVILGNFGVNGIFIFNAVLAALWLWVIFTVAKIKFLSTIILPLPDGKNIDAIKQVLTSAKGVADVAIMREEKLIYTKIDKKIISDTQLPKLIESVTLDGNDR